MEERVSVHTYVLLLFSVGQEQVEWWIHCLCVSKKEKREWGGLFLMRREFGADKEAKLLECQQEGSMYVCMCVHACVCASNYISFYSLKKKKSHGGNAQIINNSVNGVQACTAIHISTRT